MSSPTSAATRALAQARFEAETTLRHGEQLLVAIVLPVLALIALALGTVPDLGAGSRVDVATPGVLALAIISTAFTGQAIATGFDRRQGVLRLLGVSPLGRGGMMVGKTLAVLAVLTAQFVVLGGIGLALGWRLQPAGVLPALISTALGAATFLAMAMLLAGTVRAEAVLALANLAWVLFLGLGALVPTAQLPDPLVTPARLLPSGALGDAMRAALLDGAWAWPQWLVLMGWTVVAATCAYRWFTWSD